MLALFSLNQVTQLSGQVIYENLSYMSEAAINISDNEPNVLPFFPPLFFPEIGDIFILLFFFFFWSRIRSDFVKNLRGFLHVTVNLHFKQKSRSGVSFFENTVCYEMFRRPYEMLFIMPLWNRRGKKMRRNETEWNGIFLCLFAVPFYPCHCFCNAMSFGRVECI